MNSHKRKKYTLSITGTFYKQTDKKNIWRDMLNFLPEMRISVAYHSHVRSSVGKVTWKKYNQLLITSLFILFRENTKGLCVQTEKRRDFLHWFIHCVPLAVRRLASLWLNFPSSLSLPGIISFYLCRFIDFVCNHTAFKICSMFCCIVKKGSAFLLALVSQIQSITTSPGS